jgi:dTDP-4-dehydrorhamnose reductase
MLNILITGAAGQLGSEFRYLSGGIIDNVPESNKLEEIKNFNFIFFTRKQLDIQNSQQVAGFCTKHKIDVIVNCAAYTGVDKAEQEPELAAAINHLAVKNLAQVAKEQCIKLIHISTDYVFDGTAHKPYKESDTTNPQSVYGKTKLDGELAMQAINPVNGIIIRASWVYSEFGNNFVKTMIRIGKDRNELSVVCDQIGSPSNARDLASAILKIIPQLGVSTPDDKELCNKEYGNVDIYHYSNAGVCSWYDFAKAIFEINNINCKVNPIPSEAYPTPAKRPYYSVMNKSKIEKSFGVEVAYWRDSLIAMKTLNIGEIGDV